MTLKMKSEPDQNVLEKVALYSVFGYFENRKKISSS